MLVSNASCSDNSPSRSPAHVSPPPHGDQRLQVATLKRSPSAGPKADQGSEGRSGSAQRRERRPTLGPHEVRAVALHDPLRVEQPREPGRRLPDGFVSERREGGERQGGVRQSQIPATLPSLRTTFVMFPLGSTTGSADFGSRDRRRLLDRGLGRGLGHARSPCEVLEGRGPARLAVQRRERLEDLVDRGHPRGGGIQSRGNAYSLASIRPGRAFSRCVVSSDESWGAPSA